MRPNPYSRLSHVAVVAAMLLSGSIGCEGNKKLQPPDATPVLLFAGSGTSPNDVVAVESILRSEGLSYSQINSAQLNGMERADLSRYRLLIVPGGNFEEIGNALDASATAAIRGAVDEGLNYLGICAGAFFAGDSPYNGLNLTAGVRFGFYSLEDQGIRKAVTRISVPNGKPLDHYWEDGPELTGWGEVVAKYPDGTPATVQGTFGDGWVLLTGFHPEAPESWRGGMNFETPAAEDHAYAAELIQAALHRRSLARF